LLLSAMGVVVATPTERRVGVDYQQVPIQLASLRTRAQPSLTPLEGHLIAPELFCRRSLRIHAERKPRK